MHYHFIINILLDWGSIIKENVFSKGKRTYTSSKFQGEKLIWLGDILEWKLKVQVLKWIYNILRRKCKTIKNDIIYIQKKNNTKSWIFNLLKNCSHKPNKNVPIFNKKFNVIHKSNLLNTQTLIK